MKRSPGNQPTGKQAQSTESLSEVPWCICFKWALEKCVVLYTEGLVPFTLLPTTSPCHWRSINCNTMMKSNWSNFPIASVCCRFEYLNICKHFRFNDNESDLRPCKCWVEQSHGDVSVRENPFAVRCPGGRWCNSAGRRIELVTRLLVHCFHQTCSPATGQCVSPTLS